MRQGTHGGPDFKDLTPDQLADAEGGDRDIDGGFLADGCGDNEKVKDHVASKLARLFFRTSGSANVKMFEYRRRGLE